MQTADEKELSATIDQLCRAMVDVDGNTLDKLSCEELTYGHSNGRIENKDEFINTILTGRSNFLQIRLAQPYLYITGNTAVARHNFAAETNDGGKRTSILLHIIWVWKKENDTWKMLARQAVRR
ncbi:MAG TPA: nuclear transport factor 2 family protein [Chitinophagaceae bacterium]|nr:nuclear transport factor 2 family protein [Chitinophagaceae bacterium]